MTEQTHTQDNNNQFLLHVHYVPGIILETSHISAYLIFVTILQGRYHYYPHLIDGAHAGY